MDLDYCRLVKQIGERPLDPVQLTVRQMLELRAHLKTCWQCESVVEAVNRMFPEKPRIGPKEESN